MCFKQICVTVGGMSKEKSYGERLAAEDPVGFIARLAELAKGDITPVWVYRGVVRASDGDHQGAWQALRSPGLTGRFRSTVTAAAKRPPTIERNLTVYAPRPPLSEGSYEPDEVVIKERYAPRVVTADGDFRLPEKEPGVVDVDKLRALPPDDLDALHKMVDTLVAANFAVWLEDPSELAAASS